MERRQVRPRVDWQARVEVAGLVWHSPDNLPYWNEAAYYVFTASEIAEIEGATSELYRLFLAAGDHIVANNLFSKFGIAEWCRPLICDAWHAEPTALNYGRFDLGFDGKGPPRLFEFNCDTPTSLLEAAVVQWQWKSELFPHSDQFNSLHEKLVAKWRGLRQAIGSEIVHFAFIGDDTGEDAITVAYLMDTARQAGVIAKALAVEDIGCARDAKGVGFYDLDMMEIRTLYKLYPWEWLVNEPFGRKIVENAGRTLWLEPIWKMIWSNKAILPILWDLFPNHPNLLWANADRPLSKNWVSKPLLGREGEGVTLTFDHKTIDQSKAPAIGPVVYQEYYPLPDFEGHRPVIGSWIVDGEAAGMGIREDGPITGNLARFVPHLIG